MIQLSNMAEESVQEFTYK